MDLIPLKFHLFTFSFVIVIAASAVSNRCWEAFTNFIECVQYNIALPTKLVLSKATTQRFGVK